MSEKKFRAVVLSVVMVLSVVAGGVSLGTGVAAAANDAGNVSASDLNGTGTSEDPYQIENWYHLDYINDEPDAHYIVVNDIDSSTPGYEALVGNQKDDFEIEIKISDLSGKIEIPFNKGEYDAVSVETGPGDYRESVSHSVNHPKITIDENLEEYYALYVTYENASVGWNPIGNYSSR